MIEKRTLQSERRYGNVLEVSFGSDEFTIDFGQWHQDGTEAYLHTGIVMTPAVAQEFAKTLVESIDAWHDRRSRDKALPLPEGQ